MTSFDSGNAQCACKRQRTMLLFCSYIVVHEWPTYEWPTTHFVSGAVVSAAALTTGSAEEDCSSGRVATQPPQIPQIPQKSVRIVSRAAPEIWRLLLHDARVTS